MVPYWAAAVSVLGTAFLHILISRGYLKRAIEEYDKRFTEIREDQGKQWTEINEHGKGIAALKERRCPLPDCPVKAAWARGAV